MREYELSPPKLIPTRARTLKERAETDLWEGIFGAKLDRYSGRQHFYGTRPGRATVQHRLRHRRGTRCVFVGSQQCFTLVQHVPAFPFPASNASRRSGRILYEKAFELKKILQ